MAVDAGNAGNADAATFAERPTTERDAAACAPLRVLAVHTAIDFHPDLTAFGDALRARGKTKPWQAFHPALELVEEKDRNAKPKKHYLPACNFIPEHGGIPCLDFDACEAPVAADTEGFADAEAPLLACRGKAPRLYRWQEDGSGALDVFEAAPPARAWKAIETLRPKGGCVARVPGIIRIERPVYLNE